MFCLALGTELSQDDDAPWPCEGSEDFSILCHWKTCRILRFVPATDFLRSCSCSVGQDDSEDEEPAPRVMLEMMVKGSRTVIIILALPVYI